MELYNVLVAQSYKTKGGEERIRWHQVGTMGAAETGGYWIEIPSGMSVTGRLVVKPRRVKQKPEN